jgi:hypothetical protein
MPNRRYQDGAILAGLEPNGKCDTAHLSERRQLTWRRAIEVQGERGQNKGTSRMLMT